MLAHYWWRVGDGEERQGTVQNAARVPAVAGKDITYKILMSSHVVFLTVSLSRNARRQSFVSFFLLPRQETRDQRQ